MQVQGYGVSIEPPLHPGLNWTAYVQIDKVRPCHAVHAERKGGLRAEVARLITEAEQVRNWQAEV